MSKRTETAPGVQGSGENVGQVVCEIKLEHPVALPREEGEQKVQEPNLHLPVEAIALENDLDPDFFIMKEKSPTGKKKSEPNSSRR